MPRTTWEGALHGSFRLLPVSDRSGNLAVLLDSEGLNESEVVPKLPYDAARGAGAPSSATGRRYREARYMYQTLGLLHEDQSDRLVITPLGRTVQRWLSRLTYASIPVLGRYAASALAGAQLRNPTGAGRHYDDAMDVFPYSFIWRAMLQLDNQISSDELNREIFRVRNSEDLALAIEAIRAARADDDPSGLRDETITASNKNDRIIPWVAVASFGWTLIMDKREDPDRKWYRIRPNCVGLLREASRVEHRYHAFDDVPAYVNHLSRLAAAPPDLR